MSGRDKSILNVIVRQENEASMLNDELNECDAIIESQEALIQFQEAELALSRIQINLLNFLLMIYGIRV